MKILGFDITRSEKQAPYNIYGVQSFEGQRGIFDGKGDKSKMLATYGSWVYACATKRAQSVARAKFRLYKRNASDDYTELDDHSALLVLEKPNPIETKYQYLFRTILHMDLTGDAYSLIVRDNARRIRELWTLQPDQVTVVPNADGTIKRYDLRVGTDTIALSPDDVIHYKHPSPDNPFYGSSVVMAVAQSVDINHFQHNYQRNFYKRSAIPPAILTTDSKLDSATIDRLRDSFQSVYGGGDNQGKTMILENGLKYNPVGINPKDLDWLATNRYTLQEICAIFGVPPAMLGIVEDVNRANAESQEYTYAKMTVEPLLTNIDEQLTISFIRQFGDGSTLFIQHDSTVPEDEERQARASQYRISSGQNTINEERKIKGWKPITGGNTLLVPANLTTIDKLIAGQNNPTQQSAPDTTPQSQQV